MRDFGTTVELPFEDTIMKCPANYHEYLTIQFGDYMKLPPENKRAQHHTEMISTVKSYKDFKKE